MYLRKVCLKVIKTLIQSYGLSGMNILTLLLSFYTLTRNHRAMKQIFILSTNTKESPTPSKSPQYSWNESNRLFTFLLVILQIKHFHKFWYSILHFHIAFLFLSQEKLKFCSRNFAYRSHRQKIKYFPGSGLFILVFYLQRIFSHRQYSFTGEFASFPLFVFWKSCYQVTGTGIYQTSAKRSLSKM